MARPKYSIEARTQSGIYAIANTVNGWMYIGQTAFKFSERWSNHIVLLNKGTHPRFQLQADWNIYGASAFDFRILEFRRLGLDPQMDYLAVEKKHIRAALVPLYNHVS